MSYNTILNIEPIPILRMCVRCGRPVEIDADRLLSKEIICERCERDDEHELEEAGNEFGRPVKTIHCPLCTREVLYTDTVIHDNKIICKKCAYTPNHTQDTPKQEKKQSAPRIKTTRKEISEVDTYYNKVISKIKDNNTVLGTTGTANKNDPYDKIKVSDMRTVKVGLITK